jgi:hypothetical protein
MTFNDYEVFKQHQNNIRIPRESENLYIFITFLILINNYFLFIFTDILKIAAENIIINIKYIYKKLN